VKRRRGGLAIYEDHADIAVGGRDERALQALQPGLFDLDNVEGCRDGGDRDLAALVPQMVVNRRGEALGVRSRLLDRHAVERQHGD